MRKSVGQAPTAGEQTQQKPCRTSSDIGEEQENRTVGRGSTWDRKEVKAFSIAWMLVCCVIGMSSTKRNHPKDFHCLIFLRFLKLFQRYRYGKARERERFYGLSALMHKMKIAYYAVTERSVLEYSSCWCGSVTNISGLTKVI
jgi:hypothetical protein